MAYVEFTAIGYSEEYQNFALCGRELAIRLSQLFKSRVQELDSGYAVSFDGHGMLLGKDIKPNRWFMRVEPSPFISDKVIQCSIRTIVEILSTDNSISDIVVGD